MGGCVCVCLELGLYGILERGRGRTQYPWERRGCLLRKEKNEPWINGSQVRIKLPGARWKSQCGDKGSARRHEGSPRGETILSGKRGVTGQRRG